MREQTAETMESRSSPEVLGQNLTKNHKFSVKLFDTVQSSMRGPIHFLEVLSLVCMKPRRLNFANLQAGVL